MEKGHVLTCRFAWMHGLVRHAAVLALVDGLVDAANGAVEAGLAEDGLDDAVFECLDDAQGVPVPGHDESGDTDGVTTWCCCAR